MAAADQPISNSAPLPFISDQGIEGRPATRKANVLCADGLHVPHYSVEAREDVKGHRLEDIVKHLPGETPLLHSVDQGLGHLPPGIGLPLQQAYMRRVLDSSILASGHTITNHCRGRGA